MTGQPDYKMPPNEGKQSTKRAIVASERITRLNADPEFVAKRTAAIRARWTKHTFRLPPDLAAKLADYAARKRVPQALIVERRSHRICQRQL